MSLFEAIAKRYTNLDSMIKRGKVDPATLVEKYSYLVSKQSLGIANTLSADVALADDKEASIPFTVTTLDEDRDGDIVVPMGCRLVNYSKNPVWFFGHQEKPIPIGQARKSINGPIAVFPEENRVRAVCYFDKPDPDAMFIYGKVKRGLLNATSIAFVPIEATRREFETKAKPRNDQHASAPGWIFKSWDLTEISIVGVPANADAIRDVLDQEKSFISPMLQKGLQRYAAKARGRCFSGYCPCGPCEVPTKSHRKPVSKGMKPMKRKAYFDEYDFKVGDRVYPLGYGPQSGDSFIDAKIVSINDRKVRVRTAEDETRVYDIIELRPWPKGSKSMKRKAPAYLDAPELLRQAAVFGRTYAEQQNKADSGVGARFVMNEWSVWRRMYSSDIKRAGVTLAQLNQAFQDGAREASTRKSISRTIKQKDARQIITDDLPGVFAACRATGVTYQRIGSDIRIGYHRVKLEGPKTQVQEIATQFAKSVKIKGLVPVGSQAMLTSAATDTDGLLHNPGETGVIINAMPGGVYEIRMVSGGVLTTADISATWTRKSQIRRKASSNAQAAIDLYANCAKMEPGEVESKLSVVSRLSPKELKEVEEATGFRGLTSAKLASFIKERNRNYTRAQMGSIGNKPLSRKSSLNRAKTRKAGIRQHHSSNAQAAIDLYFKCREMEPSEVESKLSVVSRLTPGELIEVEAALGYRGLTSGKLAADIKERSRKSSLNRAKKKDDCDKCPKDKPCPKCKKKSVKRKAATQADLPPNNAGLKPHKKPKALATTSGTTGGYTVGDEEEKATNHMGEREFSNYNAWVRACKQKNPNAIIEGNKDIANAKADGKGIGEWDGDVGVIYSTKSAKKKTTNKISQRGKTMSAKTRKLLANRLRRKDVDEDETAEDEALEHDVTEEVAEQAIEENPDVFEGEETEEEEEVEDEIMDEVESAEEEEEIPEYEENEYTSDPENAPLGAKAHANLIQHANSAMEYLAGIMGQMEPEARAHFQEVHDKWKDLADYHGGSATERYPDHDMKALATGADEYQGEGSGLEGEAAYVENDMDEDEVVEMDEEDIFDTEMEEEGMEEFDEDEEEVYDTELDEESVEEFDENSRIEEAGAGEIPVDDDEEEFVDEEEEDATSDVATDEILERYKRSKKARAARKAKQVRRKGKKPLAKRKALDDASALRETQEHLASLLESNDLPRHIKDGIASRAEELEKVCRKMEELDDDLVETKDEDEIIDDDIPEETDVIEVGVDDEDEEYMEKDETVDDEEVEEEVVAKKKKSNGEPVPAAILNRFNAKLGDFERKLFQATGFRMN